MRTWLLSWNRAIQIQNTTYMHTYIQNYSMRSAGLHWQPYQCRVRREHEVDVVSCAQKRHICFVGDSHMRHAYNGVTSLFRRSYEWHGAVGAAKTDKGVLQVHV